MDAAERAVPGPLGGPALQHLDDAAAFVAAKSPISHVRLTTYTKSFQEDKIPGFGLSSDRTCGCKGPTTDPELHKLQMPSGCGGRVVPCPKIQ